MTRLTVAWSGLLASMACGALYALALVWVALLLGNAEEGLSGFDPGELAAAFGLSLVVALVGVVVGVPLGIAPIVVVVIAWGPLQHRLGVGRAVLAAAGVVGVVVLAETLLMEPVRSDVTWGGVLTFHLPVAALSALCAGLFLRLGLVSTQHRVARRGY